MNGLEAWCRLAKRYQPDTPVRRLQRLIEMISVSKARSAADLGSMVERWELRLKTYESEMAHVLDGHIKTAALLGMCPHDLQDIPS